ncbi:protein ANTAGONIST OF LIKE HETEROCHROMATIN PROTEIN 1-like isoform X1 [Aphis craccivora]|uniref:Protein ANTAGONIST OF LIKE HETEROCHROMATIN PROTEIN 1-like isoform X1 n=1 Tax=Aphis craccivora TaxID=307492 RepID=A0A6G0W1I1_APHCR|nr:protein ANTAGONIST OF LIKE HETEROCHROMATIN PROTEIN 1-like isoform X1 [Aphis craccivora]
MIALILDEEEEINSKKRKKKHDVQKFYEYFRMTQYSFHILLGKIETKIKKQETHWRKPISARERLAVCLSLLLMYMFVMESHLAFGEIGSNVFNVAPIPERNASIG